MLVLGIDVGTQGARVLVSDLAGRLLAEASVPFPPAQLVPSAPGRFEQDPRTWRVALLAALTQAAQQLVERGEPTEAIAALSVTSTSGTLCLVDGAGEPVGNAIMYSDTRASAVAAEVQAAGQAWAEKMGTRFNASFALCKWRWVQQHEPQRLAQARWALSPADLITGWLTGVWGVSDWTNALKWGYDVVDLAWPAFIAADLGLPQELLPRVQAPGCLVAPLCAEVAAQTGLSPRTLVMSGSTDGTASQLASGAVNPGDWNSTLGTTLVLKGVSAQILRDPLGRIYCHRHPDGHWLPGGASSSGADCLAQRFPAARLSALNAAAARIAPTDLLIYPLMRQGERFPFYHPQATGFVLGVTEDEATLFAAHLEGLAYVERLCYEVIESLGAPVGETLYVAGGASHSSAGVQIRADVLGKRLAVPEVPAGAMGAAILAARGCAFARLGEAVAQMVHYQQVVEPRTERRAAYEERYQRFCAACRERGYLP